MLRVCALVLLCMCVIAHVWEWAGGWVSRRGEWEVGVWGGGGLGGARWGK